MNLPCFLAPEPHFHQKDRLRFVGFRDLELLEGTSAAKLVYDVSLHRRQKEGEEAYDLRVIHGCPVGIVDQFFALVAELHEVPRPILLIHPMCSLELVLPLLSGHHFLNPLHQFLDQAC